MAHVPVIIVWLSNQQSHGPVPCHDSLTAKPTKWWPNAKTMRMLHQQECSNSLRVTRCMALLHGWHSLFIQNPRCRTKPWTQGTPNNGEMARARHCQCLKMEILSVHIAVLIHAKKLGFVTTSIELNEHDFWARCTVRMQWKQVPVQLDCH